MRASARRMMPLMARTRRHNITPVRRARADDGAFTPAATRAMSEYARRVDTILPRWHSSSEHAAMMLTRYAMLMR